jgi:hypothetical protein
MLWIFFLKGPGYEAQAAFKCRRKKTYLLRCLSLLLSGVALASPAHAGQGFTVHFCNLSGKSVNVDSISVAYCWQGKDLDHSFTMNAGEVTTKYTEASNSAGTCDLAQASRVRVPIRIDGGNPSYFHIA